LIPSKQAILVFWIFFIRFFSSSLKEVIPISRGLNSELYMLERDIIFSRILGDSLSGKFLHFKIALVFDSVSLY
jgi:hypothetical protein